ncbi:MAG TPA: NTPase, partial [Epsilonproteobacteria bacterium]|nr:NTPase [Campylobacterota bacterium]
MERRMTSLGLTDKPVSSLKEESLGVNDYMVALSNFIETCETPMTIAIQADWGAGKTSMMNLVKERLSDSDKKIETIWFNTWQFSQFDMGDDLPISLLSQFVKRLGGEDSGEVIKKLAGLTKKAGGMLAKVALGGAAGELIDGGSKVVDSLFENNLDVSEQIVKLKSEIESIVSKKIAKDGNDRVVVFIDDLDRLVPEKAVELLEVMKLFLDIPQCVFVLAVDYN